MSVSGAFDPFQAFHGQFTLAGNVRLDRCPVCASPEIGRLWQMPQTRLRETLLVPSREKRWWRRGGHKLNYMALLRTPQKVYAFDICRQCQTIFRNPKEDAQAHYRNDTSKVTLHRKIGSRRFTPFAKFCETWWPPGTKFMVDAACGSGQLLAVLHRRHPDLKLLGLELSRPSVEYIRSLGIGAEIADLDHDDLDAIVPPGTADFVAMREVFEHLRLPLVVLKKLMRMLRPGGRLVFTAQYYGPDVALPVRIGEAICLNRHGLDWLLTQLDGDVVDLVVSEEFRVTLQKR